MRSLAFLTTAFATTTWALERTVAPRSEQFDEPPNAALVRRRLAEVERGVEAARSNGRRRRPVDDAPGALQDWFAADSAPSRLFDTNDDITADECADLVHAEGCYESTPNWNVKLDDDVAIDAPSDPASCRTCGYGQRIFDVSAVYDCQTCEDGAEIVVFYDDCTGVCADPGGVTKLHLCAAWSGRAPEHLSENVGEIRVRTDGWLPRRRGPGATRLPRGQRPRDARDVGVRRADPLLRRRHRRGDAARHQERQVSRRLLV